MQIERVRENRETEKEADSRMYDLIKVRRGRDRSRLGRIQNM